MYSNKSLKKKILQEVTSGGNLYDALKPGSGEIRKSFKSAKALSSLVGDIVNTDQEENLILIQTKLAEASIKNTKLMEENEGYKAKVGNMQATINQYKS